MHANKIIEPPPMVTYHPAIQHSLTNMMSNDEEVLAVSVAMYAFIVTLIGVVDVTCMGPVLRAKHGS